MSLNVTNVQKLIDHLEHLEERHFNMFSWIVINPYHEVAQESLEQASVVNCGTSACVAGWTVLLFAPKNWTVDSNGDLREETGRRRDVAAQAMNLLGLDVLEADELFYDLGASREKAIAKLKDLVIKHQEEERQ